VEYRCAHHHHLLLLRLLCRADLVVAEHQHKQRYSTSADELELI
jgi:hypothetical protein